MNTTSRRFRRGETSPERPGLVFWAYNGIKEEWVTPQGFEKRNSDGRKRVAKWAAKCKAEWEASKEQSPRQWKRGDTCEARPGLIFWGLWHAGRERWVTPEKFEYLRLQKNEVAKGFIRSEASKAKQSIKAKERYAKNTPEDKARLAKKARDTRHIYSPRYREKRTAKKKLRRATDPIFRLVANVGTRLREGLKRQSVRKQNKTIEILGCSFSGFRKWLEAQFEPGMSWDNYKFDGWHVDHVVPVNLFDLSCPVAQRFAFNYRNCRPAWGQENLSKNGRLDMALVTKHNLYEWLPYVEPQPA